MSGTGGTGSGTGGTAGRATDVGLGGSAGGAAACAGSRTELTIDGTRWIEGACNDYEIQGRWYCFTDDIADNDCDKEVGPRYDRKLVGYCLSGTTILDSAFKAWGASLAFELNGDPALGKSAYDAKAHGIVGFAVTVQGITSGNPLRLGFAGASNGAGVAPFVELPPLDNETRTLTALFDEASVPPGFPNAGEVVDPTAIGDVELQVVGNLREAPFEYCITQVAPILAPNN